MGRGRFGLARAVPLLFALLLPLVACTPNRIANSTNYDLVATTFDPSEDFGAGLTFVLPDTISHIVESGDEPTRTYDDQILDRIRTNLVARGYVEDADGDPTDADYVVQAVVAETRLTITSYWGGWGGYYGGWSPVYPPGYSSAYFYDAGTVAWGMFDVPRRDPASGTVPLVWVAFVNGLLDQGTQAGPEARIDGLIDQAFAQSPYIQHVGRRAGSGL
ncbi:MAG: DUF4136 domain-containing protein [Candidatus Eiseniibacteriota bacterium]